MTAAKRILIVEDDRATRMGLQELLRQAGYDVIIAAEFRAGRRALEDERPDLLILDEPTAVLAPSESDELLRWLRGFADRGGSVVLVTHKLREALAIAPQRLAAGLDGRRDPLQ